MQAFRDAYSTSYFPRRYLLAIISFFGLMCTFMLRVTMGVAMVAIDDDKTGEYKWSAQTKGLILSAASYGLLLTPIPCGILAMMWDPKHLYTIASLVTGVASLLIPVCANIGPAALFIDYAITGLAQGASNPSVQIIWSYWAPPQEKSTLIAFSYAGMQMGVAFGFAVGSAITYWISWKAAFYIVGVLQLLWALWFHYGASNTPSTHPTISDEELCYISRSIGVVKEVKVTTSWGSFKRLPWKAILLNPPFWALSAIFTSYIYAYYTMVTVVQEYMDYMRLSIISSGLMLSAPFVALAFTTAIAGYLADKAVERGMHITTVRKLSMCVAGFVQFLGFLILGYVRSSYFGSEICVFMITAIGGTARGTISTNTLDISGPYGGLVIALSNTIALIGSVAAPQIGSILGLTGVTDPAIALHHWRIIFGIAASISIVAVVIYAIWGSGEKQEWIKQSEDVPVSEDEDEDEGEEDDDDERLESASLLNNEGEGKSINAAEPVMYKRDVQTIGVQISRGDLDERADPVWQPPRNKLPSLAGDETFEPGSPYSVQNEENVDDDMITGQPTDVRSTSSDYDNLAERGAYSNY